MDKKALSMAVLRPRINASFSLSASIVTSLRAGPLFACASLLVLECGCTGGGTKSGPPPVSVYTLTVDSGGPVAGVAINVSPADNSGAGNGSTSFTRSYNAGTSVTLTALTSSSGNPFSSWGGCGSTSGATCTVTMNGNITLTASYNNSAITSITVLPNTAIVGTQVQFAATVNGSGTSAMASPGRSPHLPAALSVREPSVPPASIQHRIPHRRRSL